MQGIEFDEIKESFGKKPPKKKTGIVDLILKTGLVKDAEQANYVLLGFVVVALLLTLYLLL